MRYDIYILAFFVKKILLPGEFFEGIALRGELSDSRLISLNLLLQLLDLDRLRLDGAVCLPPDLEIVGIHDKGKYEEDQEGYCVFEPLIADDIVKREIFFLHNFTKVNKCCKFEL